MPATASLAVLRRTTFLSREAPTDRSYGTQVRRPSSLLAAVGISQAGVPLAVPCEAGIVRDRMFGSAGVGFKLLWYLTGGRFDRLQRQAFGHA